MNRDLVDLEKLAAAAAGCIGSQEPAVQKALREMIATGTIDVSVDTDGYVLLSIEGNVFGRVHRSRILGAPDSLSN